MFWKIYKACAKVAITLALIMFGIVGLWLWIQMNK